MLMASNRRAVLASVVAPSVTQAHGPSIVHIALLGDSVIDNKAYVAGGPDVAELLAALAPQWRISRLAIDGAVIADVYEQLAQLHGETTHVVVSIGGNDALRESGLLDAPARSVAESLMRLSPVQDHFRRDYSRLMEAVGKHKLPTAVCTIYDPRYPDDIRRRVSSLALSIINDVITREAFARDLTLIDLRVMFDDDKDFANPIEPSVLGGMKLARAIQKFASNRTYSVIQ
jgi:hypothetical protein